MINRIWFTSDTHFGHANIIGYCRRPFASVDEMDLEMIQRWNAAVGENDDVFHLGDFAFLDGKNAASILGRLHGRKHLLWGNHDRPSVRSLAGWQTSQPYLEVVIDGRRIVLMHYAMRVWNGSHRGALHFYGHSHGTLQGSRQSCDVGVDCFGFQPVSLEQIEQRLAMLPARADASREIGE